MWKQREDGSWWANVNYRSEPGVNRIDTVPAEDVRLDERDYSKREDA